MTYIEIKQEAEALFEEQANKIFTYLQDKNGIKDGGISVEHAGILDELKDRFSWLVAAVIQSQKSIYDGLNTWQSSIVDAYLEGVQGYAKITDEDKIIIYTLGGDEPLTFNSVAEAIADMANTVAEWARIDAERSERKRV